MLRRKRLFARPTPLSLQSAPLCLWLWTSLGITPITHGGTHQRLPGRKAEVRGDREPDPPADLRGRRDMPGGGEAMSCVCKYNKNPHTPGGGRT